MNNWVFSMIAVCLSSTRSACHLIEQRQYWDAKLIIRSVFNTLVDVLYVLYQPDQHKVFRRLLAIEYVADKQAKLCDYVRRRARFRWKLTGVEKARMRQQQARIEKMYKRAKTDPAFNASTKNWPKRWKNIKLDEKIKALMKHASIGWLSLFEHDIIDLGNSAAHSRFLMLECVGRYSDDGMFFGVGRRPTFSSRLRKPKDQSMEGLYYELFVCNVTLGAAVIDKYRIVGEIAEAQDRLIDRWKRRAKKR